MEPLRKGSGGEEPQWEGRIGGKVQEGKGRFGVPKERFRRGKVGLESLRKGSGGEELPVGR